MVRHCRRIQRCTLAEVLRGGRESHAYSLTALPGTRHASKFLSCMALFVTFVATTERVTLIMSCLLKILGSITISTICGQLTAAEAPAHSAELVIKRNRARRQASLYCRAKLHQVMIIADGAAQNAPMRRREAHSIGRGAGLTQIETISCRQRGTVNLRGLGKSLAREPRPP
jgi:hypothetical protein